jgi:hypothetical protein
MTAPTTTTRAAAPVSRLSTTAIIVIAVVAIFVLGGLGVLIGASAESDAKLPGRVGRPGGSARSLQAGGGSTFRPAVGDSTSALGAGGQTVTIANGVVTVPVPAGWGNVTVTDDQSAVQLSKQDFFAYVNAYKPEVTPESAAAVADLLNAWIYGNQGYSDVHTTQIKTDRKIGYSWVLYSATYTNASSSFSVVGELDAFVRTDGWVLAVQREAYAWSVDDAIEAFTSDDDLKTIIQGAGDSFLNG